MSKCCPKCGIDKDKTEYSASQFLKKTGWCKLCNKQYYQQNKQRVKQYIKDNKSKIDTYKKEWYQNNKQEKSAYNKEYRANNQATIASYKKDYYQKNKETILIDKKRIFNIRYNNDPNFKLRSNFSLRIRMALKKSNVLKNGDSILKYLPYSIEELKQHLEKQFEPWMTWDNHGKYDAKTWDDNNQNTWTWNIDHIIPQARLPYTSMTDDNFTKCWSLDNLRPYSAKQNIIDGNRDGGSL